MSAITVRLPDSLHRKIKEVARQDGISINQFISSAVGEKLSAVLTVDYLRERAAKANEEDFRKILDKVADVEPLEHDKI